MSEDDVQQHDEAQQHDDAAGAEATAEDAQIADTVDERAGELIGSQGASPQPAGVQGDPIGDAEEHIASLDMDEERKKVQDLQNRL